MPERSSADLGSESQLCCLFTVWPWASCSLSKPHLQNVGVRFYPQDCCERRMSALSVWHKINGAALILIFVCVLPATKPRTQRPGGTEEGGVGVGSLWGWRWDPRTALSVLGDLGRAFLAMPAPGKLAARGSGEGTGRKSAPPTVREGRDCERPLQLPA